jgi:DNA-binding beta-propeller fold protein YncE
VPQGQESAEPILLSTSATETPYCLDFDVPLQRAVTTDIGAGCASPGELLAWVDQAGIGFNWNPYSIAMTADGRVFAAEFGLRTYELTQALGYVTRFRTPTVAELTPFASVVGIAYNEDTETLWWTNAEVDGFDVRRILLLEGTLSGVPTGRRIEVPIPPTGPPPVNTGHPVGAAYDPATQRYYYLDALRDELWAIDTLGVVETGYPRTLEAYPSAYLGNAGLDAFGGAAGGPEGVRIEVPVGLFLDNDYDRVVLTDSNGSNLAQETSLAAMWAQGFYPNAAVRSRLDPNGVMYVTFSGGPGGPDGVAAIRPSPVSPTWLVLSDWSGTIPAGGSTQVTLTFRAGQREPGEYHSTLLVEDTAGVMLASVPLTLVVEAGTPAEPGPEAGMSLSVSPNPVAGNGAVTLSLVRPTAHARVAIHDVLGRQAALLHAGPLPAGVSRFEFVVGALPAGVYVVRVVAGGEASTAVFSVAR